MENKNSNKKSPLDGFKLYAEDPFPKKYISPSAGQRQRFTRVRRLALGISVAVVVFLGNCWDATKQIYKEIDNV